MRATISKRTDLQSPVKSVLCSDLPLSETVADPVDLADLSVDAVQEAGAYA